MITIENIDGIQFRFINESEFIKFMGDIFDENESVTEIENTLIKPLNYNNCIAYLKCYCGGLSLTEEL